MAASQVSDLSKLDAIDIDNAVAILEERSHMGLDYTMIGPVMLAVRPEIEATIDFNPDRTRPIKDLAERVLLNAAAEGRGQVVIFAGPSGAGKTFSAHCLLEEYTRLSSFNPPDPSQLSSQAHDKARAVTLKTQAQASQCILAAFGNAASALNNDSSRYAKHLQLHLAANTSELELVGITISTYFLERSRVPRPRDDESNFHILHLLATHGPRSLHVNPNDHSKFRILPHSSLNHGNFNQVTDTLSHLGFPPSKINQIWSALGAILHLGNIQLLGDQLDINRLVGDQSLLFAASLLQVEPVALAETISASQLGPGLGRRIPTCVRSQTETASMMSAIYSTVFDEVVREINRAMDIGHHNGSVKVGFLDVFGFEDLPSRNSLEQFNINTANEMLQELYEQDLLQDLNQRMASEGLAPIVISGPPSTDASRQMDRIRQIVSCIEDASSAIRRTNGDYDDAFIIQLSAKGQVRTSLKPDNNLVFEIPHTARPVKYLANGMVAKNRDTPSANVLSLLSKSILGIWMGPERGTGPLRKINLCGTYHRELEALRRLLTDNQIHWVRCLPNDKAHLKPQLEAAAVIQTIDLFKRTGPWSCSRQYTEFAKRYGTLISHIVDHLEDDHKITRAILEHVVKADTAHGFGKTMVFLHYDTIVELEQRLKEINSRKVALMSYGTERTTISNRMNNHSRSDSEDGISTPTRVSNQARGSMNNFDFPDDHSDSDDDSARLADNDYSTLDYTVKIDTTTGIATIPRTPHHFFNGWQEGPAQKELEREQEREISKLHDRLNSVEDQLYRGGLHLQNSENRLASAQREIVDLKTQLHALEGQNKKLELRIKFEEAAFLRAQRSLLHIIPAHPLLAELGEANRSLEPATLRDILLCHPHPDEVVHVMNEIKVSVGTRPLSIRTPLFFLTVLDLSSAPLKIMRAAKEVSDIIMSAFVKATVDSLVSGGHNGQSYVQAACRTLAGRVTSSVETMGTAKEIRNSFFKRLMAELSQPDNQTLDRFHCRQWALETLNEIWRLKSGYVRN